MRFALIEIAVSTDVRENFLQGEAGVSIALENSVSLVVLPELWATGFGREMITEYLADDGYGLKATMALANRCEKRGADLVYGYPEPNGTNAFYNCLSLPGYREGCQYRKLMVYTDVEVNFTPALSTDENVVAFAHRYGRDQAVVVGVQLCADLRFPEIARASAEVGAALIVNASQWRGEPRLPDRAPAHPEHWEVLVRARAIENQVYFAGCGATGTARDYHLHGHSLVADPLGRIVNPEKACEIGGYGGRVLIYDIDLSMVGGQSHTQARPFISWIHDRRTAIELVRDRTLDKLSKCSVGLSGALRTGRAQEVARTLERLRECSANRQNAPGDERELQEIVWTMLRARYEDAVREETLPRFGSKQYRPDFGVPSRSVLVEAKYLRESAHLGTIQDQILADATAYMGASSGYDAFVVLIYGANNVALDARNFVNDLRSINAITEVLLVPGF